MPKYRVTMTAGPDFPLGYEFETDNLHPVMRQHVQVVGESSAKAAPDKDDDDGEDKPLTKAQLDKLHGQALKEDAERAKAATTTTPTGGPGPGENS